MNIIANTTIISNFAEVGRLDVLRNVVGSLYISTDVYAEIEDGLEEGYTFYIPVQSEIHSVSAERWLRLATLESGDEIKLFTTLSTKLHRGEASCLAIAAKRGWSFLSDDERARKSARNLGITVSGTLGILKRAVKINLLTLDEANSVLSEMIQAGYHSPYDNLAEIP